MVNQTYTADVLVVGGGTGGIAAAIQAARRGAKTILVSEFPWLGGMLTSAGVSVPDGNELEAFQTGLWGAFLQELRQRQPGGLDNSWVSFFSYDPRIGAKIFADWVQELPNLHWISGQVPLEVFRQGDSVTGVRFADFAVTAKIILDGTELGDLLALADIPYRWGWELQSEWGEPSAPVTFNSLTQRYPVQAPTYVVIMKDFGEAIAPEIPAAPNYNPSQFTGAWDGYGAETFLNYGRLPGGLFMMNWPICGNDYGEGVGRLIESDVSRGEFIQESRWHSQNFAHFIQNQLGSRYGLAEKVFPHTPTAFALHPYYRESRRLVGLTTVREQDILPIARGRVASIFNDAIAVGNYANDHHYPGVQFPLQPKSIRWGGRWTGTPFTIPYSCLIPATTDGFLVCEKNISVSHIANGATRLQPMVMGIGQAAGMAAAICVELNCQPRDLPVRTLQTALLEDNRSKALIIPLFNLPPNHSDWRHWQLYYLENPQAYPVSGDCPCPSGKALIPESNCFTGIFYRLSQQEYRFTVTTPAAYQEQNWQLVTLRSHIDEQLRAYPHEQLVTLWGRYNHSGNWLLVEHLNGG
ncbi:FAD-dependent oxidoreductase [uncultured Nostoc sp.]|uniref:FAD-dependent oxidoreductase n=1 Tax=uncultured Nostoc sp. TaxID=340711 RepID=UPI0035CAA34E